MKSSGATVSETPTDVAYGSVVVCHPTHCEFARHQDMLLHELQHRVGNSLQIVASIIAIKARTAHSEEARLQLEDARQRVMSIATVQQHLHLSSAGRSIEMAPYLSRLCASLADSMIDNRGSVLLVARAGAGAVPIRQAETIGLIVTELVINSLKHAFPGDRGGEVRVDYEAEGTGWRLSVSDNGVGCREHDGPHAGVGMRIVGMLAQELDARIETASDENGTAISILHPAAATSVQGPIITAA